MSGKSTYNIITSVFQIPAAQKIFNYISQKINLLQKKYIIIGHNDLNKTLDIINLVDKNINISNFND